MGIRKIYVAGHNGMVGSAIVRQLQSQGLGESLVLRSRSELDLLNQSEVANFFESEQIDEVYLAAAKVGGIHANNAYPADFIYENLQIELNIINSAHQNNVDKLLFLGSSCIYPRMAVQPMTESSLLTGQLEPTNEPYAIAKIAGIKLCESYNRQYGVDYRSVMPTNLYGVNDNFHGQNSHVIPALIKRFHEAKQINSDTIEIWGTGTPIREFLYVDDMAEASIFVMNLDRQTYDEHVEGMLSHINVGTGVGITIAELAKIIANVTGYHGEIVFNSDMPDGTPKKVMNVDRLENLGWRYSTDLKSGMTKTYDWFLANQSSIRA